MCLHYPSFYHPDLWRIRKIKPLQPVPTRLHLYEMLFCTQKTLFVRPEYYITAFSRCQHFFTAKKYFLRYFLTYRKQQVNLPVYCKFLPVPPSKLHTQSLSSSVHAPELSVPQPPCLLHPKFGVSVPQASAPARFGSVFPQ